MSTRDVRTPSTPDSAGSTSIPGPLSPAGHDDYSAAFAAFALLLTAGVLAGLVLAVWTLGGL